MTEPRLRLVVDPDGRRCSCRTWGLLSYLSRDMILDHIMQWALLLHQVQLKLHARGEHVAICELLTLHRGLGRVRRIMTELCAWSDCARVTLELTPSSHWGSDVGRLTQFYISLGFEPNRVPELPFLGQESMVRYPVLRRGHVRL